MIKSKRNYRVFYKLQKTSATIERQNKGSVGKDAKDGRSKNY
jgi:hypothetical protein